MFRLPQQTADYHFSRIFAIHLFHSFWSWEEDLDRELTHEIWTQVNEWNNRGRKMPPEGGILGDRKTKLQG